MTQQNSLPMTEEEAAALAAQVEQGGEWPEWWGDSAARFIARLLADRSRDKERLARYEKALVLTPENVGLLKAQMQKARDEGDKGKVYIDEGDVGKVYTFEAKRVLAHLRRAAGMEETTNGK